MACTYNNDTIITLQKKNRHYRFSIKVYTHKKVDCTSNIIDMALKLNTLNVSK